MGCGGEVASNFNEPLPPQNHHQHNQSQGKIRRRLIVHNPNSWSIQPRSCDHLAKIMAPQDRGKTVDAVAIATSMEARETGLHELNRSLHVGVEDEFQR